MEIKDPISGYRFVIDSRSKTAHRFVWHPAKYDADPFGPPNVLSPAERRVTPPKNPVARAESDAIQRPQTGLRSLGVKYLEGIKASGYQATLIYPIEYFGNDRQITIVSRTWFSPELELQIESTVSDPRTGELITKIENFREVEPDPSLFVVPPDYSLVDLK